MKRPVQIERWLLIPLFFAGLAIPCAAQRSHEDDRPPRAQQRQQQRSQERRQERRDGRRQQRPPEQSAARVDPNPQRGPGAGNAPQNGTRQSAQAENRPPQFTPEERQRILQNDRRFRQLPPQQQQEMRERAQVWQKMTPDQRQHVRNDVLPRWQQMPPDRRQAIQQRLRVLQNMPESARIRRLNDPNFTRGMGEEDKAMLHDLSHLHVGGAPDPPNE